MFAIAALALAHGGVVQGIVLEQASGRPMARTAIGLIPVPKAGAAGQPLALRAGSSGHFLFPSVPEGLYLLTATRPHYFPAAYGQRLPHGQGTPIQVTADSEMFAELRMRRMGAISGRVLDENGVGLPDIRVVAYRARLPLLVSKDALSDDRGFYRIHGLDPGKYWIRTGDQKLDDGSGLLPTFAPESRESRDARTYPVAVDTETTDADVHPMAGALFHLGGYIQCEPLGAKVAVFLASETGRRTATTLCGERYMFEGLAPAAYEVFAEKDGGTESGFIEMFLDHDNEAGTVRLSPPTRVTFTIEGSGNAASSVRLTGRRQDLAETGSEREIKLPETSLSPGHWELSARAGPGEYVASIVNAFGGSRRSWRAERPADWFEVFVEARTQSRMRIVLSGQAGTITGVVQAEEKVAPGIPVFLWPVAEAARRSLRGRLRALADVNGKFQFDSLPPGDYRLVATFDLNELDEESLELARAVTVRVEASQTQDLTLLPWMAPY